MTTSHALSDSTFAIAMPLGLRAEAHGMCFTEFRRTYSPMSGPLRLGAFDCAARGSSRHEFSATFAFEDTIHSASTIAFGPAEAMTSMLYAAGVHLEILSFHQQLTEAGTITFALCTDGSRTEWAMGTAETAFESTARALVAGANRLA